MGGRTSAASHNISIHALLAESDPLNLKEFLWLPDISIHALLAESDRFIIVGVLLYPDISIHALLAESDIDRHSIIITLHNFYPRSPCGERLYALFLYLEH